MPKNGRPASAPLRSRSERVLDAPRPWYKVRMPSFRVETPQGCYNAIVERGIIGRAAEFVSAKSGKVFVVSTDDVWRHQGAALAAGLRDVAHEVLYLPGGAENKRMAPLESLAERMVLAGGDRASVVVAFGGGIVTDMGGFLAAIFMRGIPVIQIPIGRAWPSGWCWRAATAPAWWWLSAAALLPTWADSWPPSSCAAFR